MTDKKCEVAKNVTIDGQKFKVVDPEDSCSSVQKVLAKHQGMKVISPSEYDLMLKLKEKKTDQKID